MRLYNCYCFVILDPAKDQNTVAIKARKEVPTSLLVKQKQNSNKPKSDCFKGRFSNYLLVIIYNHPLYDSVSLLRDFYEPAFPNIYFCGEIANSTLRVHAANINKGVYGYKCLSDAIRKNPGYAGYLYINDDVIVNYWNLEKFHFNFSRIGESSNKFGKVSATEEMPKNWYWWISPYGFKNCQRTIKKMSILSERFHIYGRAFKTFYRDGEGTLYCHNGRSDIVYIPGHLAGAFHDISIVFYKYKVFLEIAIPTILRFIATNDEISTLHGLYLPGDVRKKDPRVTDSRYFWTSYLQRPSLWFIHPFKLHHYEDHNRDLSIELMKRIMIRKTEELTKC